MLLQRISRITFALIVAFGGLSSAPTAQAEFDGDVRLWQTLSINAFDNDNWFFAIFSGSMKIGTLNYF
jgi:hypothetical protein